MERYAETFYQILIPCDLMPPFIMKTIHELTSLSIGIPSRPQRLFFLPLRQNSEVNKTPLSTSTWSLTSSFKTTTYGIPQHNFPFRVFLLGHDLLQHALASMRIRRTGVYFRHCDTFDIFLASSHAAVSLSFFRVLAFRG